MCQAWRDGLAPLSAKGGGTSTPGAASSNVVHVDDDATCRDKNDLPNNASPRATSDAAGCNWVSYRDTLSTHTFCDALPHEILDKYPMVDFDLKCYDVVQSHTNEVFTTKAVKDGPNKAKQPTTIIDVDVERD